MEEGPPGLKLVSSLSIRYWSVPVVTIQEQLNCLWTLLVFIP